MTCKNGSSKRDVLLQIPLGRQCVDQYKEFGRYNVFSHEELLLRMVSKTDGLLLDMAETLYNDLLVSFSWHTL